MSDDGNFPSLAPEQPDYYWGLPSIPMLIARSSTDPWKALMSPLDSGYLRRKMLYRLGMHKIAGPWNDTQGPLRREIVAAVSALQWNTIDVLRVGWDDSPSSAAKPTILITVARGSTSYPAAMLAVRSIKQILSTHACYDVECEIKSGSHEQSVLVLSKGRSRGGELDRFEYNLSDLIGTGILCTDAGLADQDGFDQYSEDTFPTASFAYPDERDSTVSRGLTAGTKGIYLRLRQPNGQVTTLALTCRHVVFASETDRGQTYRYTSDREKRYVMQITPQTGTENVRQLGSTLRGQRRQGGLGEETLRFESLLHRYKDAECIASRIVGHVLFSPAPELCGGTWWRDYAVVELDPHAHEAAVHGSPTNLINRVMLPSDYQKTFSDALYKEKDLAMSYENLELAPDQDMTFHLSNAAIHEEELRHPPYRNAADDPVTVVGKRGLTTGLTFGFGNEVKSLARRPFHGVDVVSEE